MTGKKVLLVEDDADSASILDAYLRRDGFDVAIAGDGERAIHLHRQWAPDLVLLDVMLPGLSGIEVLSAIRRASDTPVIMVTAIGDEPEKLGALRYGADDYVVKPYSPKEVVARVHAVLRRSVAVRAPGEPLRHGRLSVDLAAVVATVQRETGDSVALDLTPTEFNLLALLLKTPFKAFTRSELLDACLPDSDALERVVDSHIHNLRRKLEVHGITGVLVTVRAVGYRFQ
ncbi:two-component system regulatory protein [Xanthomonas arboricola pv. fragariae]|uniref:Transcriptional regulatory protein BaeR n=1 Tax=Xanthomonas arboricola TaxID=56448 RepID=A0AAN2E3L4_9XANT|nr:response regulator [Xanthomonas arboricola]CAE6791000.1 Transcriptional regulatory protein BaeR [Xanthomonas arboricola]CAE6791022.1 Transcriptional regulatory protein BaeR [Xanthomonas arboricola]CAE6791390.1 Transcriptional regulatory protein BaeR [Xanthomonas arboricola]CAE6791410.1 Transcriptional regulatory protein BaeR [Xanthomonas arboricola]SOT97915.1 two-component system regulatory protein [Xanthomonas arboricola pv. fragariae]